MEGSVRSLLEAERESQEIIQKAVSEKSKRMNDANSDAQIEINAFANEFKQRFLVEESQRKAHNDDLIRAQDNIAEEMAEIEEQYEQNKRQVVKMLLDQILIVNIEVPKVVQQKFE
ncbi:hypothetical protein FGO68_gene12834 [Halteria grandinella]|uniref:V-type proton ATPase subunit G n=1 Tax=Halteria grandinella TaxID=5974 RepID=A0A8J8P1A5_HALGN|nr:hypothetical protein FGO68_gene12834 [Halteria grandinella]